MNRVAILLVLATGSAVAAACGGAELSAPSGDAGDAGTLDAGSSDATATDTSASQPDGASASDGASDGAFGVDGAFDPILPDGGCYYDFGIPATLSTAGCVFTAADVDCDASSECQVDLDLGHCLCVTPAWGVNSSNTGGCGAPPPCAPGCAGSTTGDASGYLTEDCKIVPSQADIVVSCVNHRCVTSATVGSE